MKKNETAKWNSDNTLKILAIGNSFSDDALWRLPDILKSLGVEKFLVADLYIGGCVLQLHRDNIVNDSPAYDFNTNDGSGWTTEKGVSMRTALLSREWDFITMQQGSHDSGLTDTYSPLTEIIDFVKRNKPNAKLGWQMTWAYQQDSSHWAFSRYGTNQTAMYNAIVNAVKSEIVTKREIEFIVPNGTAIQNARTSFLGDTLTRDGFHMSYDIGRYITALSYARLITGYAIDKVSYAPDGVGDDIKKVCIESVNNAISVPFAVSQSAYTIKKLS